MQPLFCCPCLMMSHPARFLMDLENRIEQSIQISDVCDIVCLHAREHFHVFITYVINQVYQEKNYRRILWVKHCLLLMMSALSSLVVHGGGVLSIWFFRQSHSEISNFTNPNTELCFFMADHTDVT